MIDHVSLPVSDLAKASAWYEAMLAPLSYTKLVVREGTVGFGKSYPEVWLNLREEIPRSPNPGGHICLRAPSEAAVRAFHAAALAQGCSDDGQPGPRQGAFT